MHDDVLLISFTTTSRSHVVSARFSTFYAGILFNSCPLGNICILNVRLGSETDQQYVIMHKAYYFTAVHLFFKTFY